MVLVLGIDVFHFFGLRRKNRFLYQQLNFINIQNTTENVQILSWGGGVNNGIEPLICRRRDESFFVLSQLSYSTFPNNKLVSNKLYSIFHSTIYRQKSSLFLHYLRA